MTLPSPETMLAYASILEKPKYDDRGFQLATGEIIEAACAALRHCAHLTDDAQAVPAPVAWRLTDGEGDYEYLTEEPSDQSRAWSRRYGREWEPLYASPVSSTPSEVAKAAPDREQLIECISRFDVFSTAAQVADAILDLSLSSTLPLPAAPKPVSFLEAMNIVERGFDTWKDKPHNAKWYSRIDGTPIPNDLKVNIAEAICHSTVTSTEHS